VAAPKPPEGPLKTSDEEMFRHCYYTAPQLPIGEFVGPIVLTIYSSAEFRAKLQLNVYFLREVIFSINPFRSLLY